MFFPQRVPKKGIRSWANTGVQRCLYPLFQNQSPILCCPHFSKFLWTSKVFISPESFLNFFLNLRIPQWLWKSFKFIVLLRDYWQIHLRVKKFNLFMFIRAPKQNSPTGFYHYAQAGWNCTFLLNSVFWRYFFLSRKGERIMELKKYLN